MACLHPPALTEARQFLSFLPRFVVEGNADQVIARGDMNTRIPEISELIEMFAVMALAMPLPAAVLGTFGLRRTHLLNMPCTPSIPNETD